MSGKQTFQEVTVEANLDIRDPIIISVSAFKGAPRLDIRHHFETDTGELVPTKKGINIPLDDVLRFIDDILVAYNQSTGNRLLVMVDEE